MLYMVTYDFCSYSSHVLYSFSFVLQRKSKVCVFFLTVLSVLFWRPTASSLQRRPNISFAKPSINSSFHSHLPKIVSKYWTYYIIIVYLSLLSNSELLTGRDDRWSCLMYVSNLHAYSISKTKWIWHLDSRKTFDFNWKVFQCQNSPYCKNVHTNFLQIFFLTI